MFTVAPESSVLTHSCVQIATLFVHTRIKSLHRQKVVGGWYTQHHLLCRLQEAEHHSYQGTLAFILLLLEGPLARGRSLPHTDMLLGLFPLPGTSTEPVIAIYLSTGSSCSSCEVAGMASHCRGEGPEVQNGEVTCLWTDGEFRLGLELREDLWACFPVNFFKIFPFNVFPPSSHFTRQVCTLPPPEFNLASMLQHSSYLQ